MAKSKKNFTDTAAARMFEEIEHVTAETPETPEAQATQRKPREKLPRINMAFSPDNYDFIQTMARVRGETLTAFVNDIMDKAREENADLYRKALLFRNTL